MPHSPDTAARAYLCQMFTATPQLAEQIAELPTHGREIAPKQTEALAFLARLLLISADSDNPHQLTQKISNKIASIKETETNQEITAAEVGAFLASVIALIRLTPDEVGDQIMPFALYYNTQIKKIIRLTSTPPPTDS